MLELWDSIGPIERKNVHGEFKKRLNEYGRFLTKEEKHLFEKLELEFGQPEFVDRDDGEGEPTETESTHRVTGRATKIEEQILHKVDTNRKEIERLAEIKSKPYSIDGKVVTARKKFNELQARWHGWTALDAEDTALLDELIGVFTKKVKTPPKVAPESNVVLLFPARMCERESDQEKHVTAAVGKQTRAVTDELGNVHRSRLEFDNFRATENELFDYNFRRARDGKLLAPDGSEVQCLESEGNTHRAKVRLVEAEAEGSTATKLDSGFPCLSAIRKKDGNIVQESKGDNRCAFEVIAQLLRLDFAAADRDYLSKPVNDVSFEDGEVDFSNDGKHFPNATMTVARREKTGVETLSHTDPKTGAVWTGEVPCFVDDGVRQNRAERLAWTWLELEVSPHQYDYKKKDSPRNDGGPAIFHSGTPVVSTEFTSDIGENGKRIQVEWIITRTRKTRTTKDGTSIWHEITRTGLDGAHVSSGVRELKLVRQTVATVVDCSRDDPSRDILDAESRLPAQQRLEALSNLLGSEMFATARMACRDDMKVGVIADTMGLGSRGGTAVARELRIIFLQAMKLYNDLASIDDSLPLIVAANDNQTARQMVA